MFRRSVWREKGALNGVTDKEILVQMILLDKICENKYAWIQKLTTRIQNLFFVFFLFIFILFYCQFQSH